MKKILYFFIAICISSCSTNQNKAEDVISESIKSQIDAEWEYIPIKFTRLSYALSNIEEEERYKELEAKYKNVEYKYLYDSIYNDETYKADSAIYGKEYADKTRINPSSEERDLIIKKIKHLKDKYTPRKIGNGIIHMYICKTNFGDSLYFSKWIFDDNFKIRKIYKISEPIESDSIKDRVEKLRKEKDWDINSDLWNISTPLN